MANPSPKVSIIVRTYSGRQELLAEALASIDAQTHRPIEVVVVEDGSVDCEPVVRELERSSDLSVVYRSVPKRGRCYAGDLGLEHATGHYVNFLDDDDQLYPSHVERLVSALELDERAPAAFGRSEVVRTDFRSLRPLDYEERGRWEYRARTFTRWHLWAENQFPIQACLFRRRLHQEHGGFDGRFELLEDWELWARYFSSEEPPVFVDEVTSMFRLPAGSSEVRRTRKHVARSADVVVAIRSIEVTVSPVELQHEAARLLGDIFADSGWLSKTWSTANVTRLLTRGLLGPLIGLLAASETARVFLRRPTTRGLSPAAQQLLFDVRRHSDGLPQRVTVGEAQLLAREVWRSEDPQRYALLALRNVALRLRRLVDPPAALLQPLFPRPARPPYGVAGR